MTAKKSLLKKNRKVQGATVIIVALVLPILFGFAGMALDVGRLMVVKNELQNAADAAALAGAARLWHNNTSKTPDWASAETAASTAAPTNSSGGVVLLDYDVLTGYWNLDGTPADLQPTDITPGDSDVPAVRVVVRKAAGENGGPVTMVFGAFMGKSTVAVVAEAIAISSSPASVSPGTLLPIVISKDMADKKDEYNRPGKEFKIGSAYHYPDSMAGQWTSLTLNTNNVPTVRDLIEHGNPDPLGIGTMIWIQPGTKTTLYNSIPVGRDVVLPVVDCDILENTHAAVPVHGFVGFRITASVGGSGKYIEGYFLDNIKIGGGGPGGPNYGVFIPPKLVR